MKDEKLDYFKKLVMEHLNGLEEKKDAEKREVKKSILEAESMQKAGYPVGTIREWKGRKYIKIAPNKWRPKYDGNSRGAKLSIAALKRKADECKSSEELLQLVLENRERFSDEMGRPLPFVKELSDYISAKNDELESKKEISQDASKYGFKPDDLSKRGYKIVDEYKGMAIIEKNGKYFLGGISPTKKRLSITPYLRAENIEDVKTAFDKDIEFFRKREAAKENIKKEEEQKKNENKQMKNLPVGLKEKARGMMQRIGDSASLTGYNTNKTKAYTLKRTEGGYSFTVDDINSGDSKTYNLDNPATEKKPSENGVADIRKKYESFKSVEGNKKTVTLPNGNKIKCHYKIVEADAPTASHDERTYAPTEGFPKNENGQNINDRDYQNDVDAQESVRRIAANFNSLALESPPIVTKDGIVISGNNRTMSSKLAARNGTDKAYLNDLREMIDEYGLEESDLEGFKNPRLVLEVDQEHEGDYTTEEFAQFNRDTKKTMSNVEKAVKLTKTLNEQKISSIASELSNYDTMSDMYNDPKGSQAFVSKLIEAGIIGDNEKAQYCKSDGTLNDTGKDFVETVLVGSVLNENNIRKLDGAGGKRIRQKLVRAILPLIENKGNGKEYSFNAELNTAVDIAVTVAKDHDTFKTVADYLAQGSLFGDKRPDEVTGKLAKIIHDDGEKAFAQRMKDLGAGLQESASGVCDIFLGGVESKQSLMERFLDIKKSIADILTNFVRKERTTRELVADVLSDIV